MTIELAAPPPVSGHHARQAMAAALHRTTEALAGADPIDDVRTVPLDRDLRVVVDALGRSEDRGVQRTVAALRGACAHLAAGRAEDAFLALEDARQRLRAA